MKILFATSECTPFAKTGGLADVLGELPYAILSLLNKETNGSQVVTVLPKYLLIGEKSFDLQKLPGKILVSVGDRIEEGIVWKTVRPDPLGQNGDVTVYFIENKKYFDRPALYRTAEKDFVDNDERFIFFSRAVLELCKFVDFVPDIVHCHDWQTGLIPAYLKTVYRADAFFHRTATVFTIHNIAYQGIFPKQTLFWAGFSWHDFTPEYLEYYNQICFLKAGLVYADKISTVSPTYAQEVMESAEFGRGMEGVLKVRKEDFVGILNGLDTQTWDPSKDLNLAMLFSIEDPDLIKKKKVCKKNLQKSLQLPAKEKVPLIGMVARLDLQKGFLKVGEILRKILDKGIQFQWVVLGLGDQNIRDLLSAIAKEYPHQVSFKIGFNSELAHKIYGGADLFFMPSEFEPCGLGQMIALRYGCIPIVTPTGGLRDTVEPWDPTTGKGTGFISSKISTASLIQSLETALKTYCDPVQWEKLVRNAMKKNFSWSHSAMRYLELYRSALKSRLEI